MPLDGGATTVLSAVSGALTTTIRITEKVFEILAVGEQSRSLLATINQVNQQLETARTLRRQKSGLLSTIEKQSIQQTFLGTEEALEHVAKLVEKTRVDQQIHGGRVGFCSRMHFVLKDSPNIMVSLTQLGIANQQLNTTVIMLYHRQSPRIIVAQSSAVQTSGFGLERKPPPGYEESQLIAAARQKNLRKRASALGIDDALTGLVNTQFSLPSSPSTHSLPAELAGDNIPEHRADNLLDIDFDKSSITSSLLDGMFDQSQYAERSVSTPPGPGRARSRRWLEAHCN